MHFRMYLKRKKDGKYVNAHEVCEWQPDGTTFAEPFSGRCYDVFSLFGSGRGNYPPLPGARYGMPGFLEGSDFDEYCREFGFYGFTWFYAGELEKEVTDFAARLRDPLKFLEEDSDEHARWKDLRSPGEKTAEQMAELHDMYVEWLDEHGTMMRLVDELLVNIRHFTLAHLPDDGNGGPPPEWNRPGSPYNKMFDMDKTVFLFFFDS